MTHTIALYVAAVFCLLQGVNDIVGATTFGTELRRAWYGVTAAGWAFALYGILAALGWVL